MEPHGRSVSEVWVTSTFDAFDTAAVVFIPENYGGAGVRLLDGKRPSTSHADDPSIRPDDPHHLTQRDVMMAEETTSPEVTAPDPGLLVELTSVVVSADLAHNHVTAADVPALIHTVHGSLSGLGQPAPASEAPAEPLKPAVPIKKSVTDEFILSLEDGKRYKALKRHLGKLGLTPEAYRAKWSLPKDYPMTALFYTQARSTLAKASGLGALRRKG